jgi:hypothetical protein
MNNQSIHHNLSVIFLLINAVYWGLFPHSAHCAFIKSIGITNCPSHIFHVMFGIVCFLIAIYIRQGNIFNK